MDKKTVDALLLQVIKHNESIIEDLRKLGPSEEVWVLLDSIRGDQQQIEETITRIKEIESLNTADTPS